MLLVHLLLIAKRILEKIALPLPLLQDYAPLILEKVLCPWFRSFWEFSFKSQAHL